MNTRQDQTKTTKKLALSVASMFLAVTVLAACGSGEMGQDATYNSPAGATANNSMLLSGPTFNSTPKIISLYDASGANVTQALIDPYGNFTLLNLAQGEYTVLFLDAFQNLISSTTLTLTGDALSVTGSSSTASSTWVVEYAPVPAPEPDPVVTDDTVEGKRANIVSSLTGIPAVTILEMRAAGMGWGQIAQQLGLSPKELGFGHDNGKGKGKK